MNQILPTATTSDEKARGADCAVLPIGSFEQHGDYLPLITDTVIASAISRELANSYSLLQLPPVTISCSHEHSAWRGTVSISSSTLHSMIDDIYRSITDSGLTSLVIVNCHGGNYVLANIVQEGNAHGKRIALFPSGPDWADARQSGRLATSNHEDMHAGELEASILLHVNPELVRDGYQAADWTADDRRHLLTTGMSGYTQNGVIGRPSLASAEKGKALLASLVESFASVLEILRRALREQRLRTRARPSDDLMGLGFDVTRVAALGEYFERVEGPSPSTRCVLRPAAQTMGAASRAGRCRLRSIPAAASQARCSAGCSQRLDR